MGGELRALLKKAWIYPLSLNSLDKTKSSLLPQTTSPGRQTPLYQTEESWHPDPWTVEM